MLCGLCPVIHADPQEYSYCAEFTWRQGKRNFHEWDPHDCSAQYLAPHPLHVSYPPVPALVSTSGMSVHPGFPQNSTAPQLRRVVGGGREGLAQLRPLQEPREYRGRWRKRRDRDRLHPRMDQQREANESNDCCLQVVKPRFGATTVASYRVGTGQAQSVRERVGSG